MLRAVKEEAASSEQRDLESGALTTLGMLCEIPAPQARRPPRAPTLPPLRIVRLRIRLRTKGEPTSRPGIYEKVPAWLQAGSSVLGSVLVGWGFQRKSHYLFLLPTPGRRAGTTQGRLWGLDQCPCRQGLWLEKQPRSSFLPGAAGGLVSPGVGSAGRAGQAEPRGDPVEN